MARVPTDSYGQSRYTEQILQSVLIPTVVCNDGKYEIETTISATSIRASNIFAANIYATGPLEVGDLLTETLALGRQSMQGTFVPQIGSVLSCVSTTVVGVRAVGNEIDRGTFDGNVVIGAETGLNLSNTNYSVYVGAGAGTYGEGTSNVVVGYGASVGLGGNFPTTGNVILGAGAGISNAGNSNVFIGVDAGADLIVSNTLVINTTSESSNALIYGQFDTQRLGINCIPTESFQVSGNTILSGTLEVEGTISNTPSTKNYVGGVYLHNSNLSLAGTVSNVASTTNFIGGVYLHNSNLSLAGTVSNVASTTNFIGGVYLHNSNLSLAGTVSNVASTTNFIGGVYLQNSNLSLAGTIRNLSSTVNFIGGVTLSGSNVTTLTGRIGAGNLYGSTGGVTVLNPNNIQVVSNDSNRFLLETNGTFSACNLTPDTTFTLKADSGNISNLSNSSNDIGGVVLCNKQLIVGALNYFTVSYLQIRDSGTQNRFLIGDFQGNNTYELGAFHDNGTLKTFNLDSSTGNISNLSNSSNTIGGITIQNGLVQGARISNYPVGTGIPLFTDSVGNVGMCALRGATSRVDLQLKSCNTVGSTTTVNTLTLDASGALLAPGRISNALNSSNRIGGIILSNYELDTSGGSIYTRSGSIFTTGGSINTNAGPINTNGGPINTGGGTINTGGGIIYGNGSGLTNLPAGAASALTGLTAGDVNGNIRIGNIRIQWGFFPQSSFTPGTGNGTISFYSAFTTRPGVTLNWYATSGGGQPVSIQAISVTGITFGSGYVAEGYFWLAIGGA